MNKLERHGHTGIGKLLWELSRPVIATPSTTICLAKAWSSCVTFQLLLLPKKKHPSACLRRKIPILYVAFIHS